MRVGLHLDVRNPSWTGRRSADVYAATLELCQEADRLGVDSLWFSEHHGFEDGYLPQPLVMAAAAAARTRAARVGTAVLLAPLRHPAAIAEEAAVVDLVSGGRLELGLGAGYVGREFALMDANPATRYAVTDATAREVRRLWASGEVTPAPAQTQVPIWMGYQGPRGARRAGLLGEGLLSVSPGLLEPYLEGLVAGGHDPLLARMSGSLGIFVSDDPERDWETVVRRHHEHHYDSYRRHSAGSGDPDERRVDSDRCRGAGLGGAAGSILVATPEDAAAQAREHLRGLPVHTVIIWAALGGLPEDVAQRHVELLCTRFAPLLRANDDDESAEVRHGSV